MAKAMTRPEPAQAIILRLDKDTIAAIRKSQSDCQLLSGSSLRLRVNRKALNLQTRPASQTDLYTYTAPSRASVDKDARTQQAPRFAKWRRVGIVSDRAELRRGDEKATTGMGGEDAALAALEQSLATLEKEKLANSTHITTSVIANATGRRRDTSSRLLQGRTASNNMTTSDGSRDRTASKVVIPISVDDPSQWSAHRKVLTHLLAMGPANVEELSRRTCISRTDLQQILPRIASQTRDAEQTWELNGRAYKDLDVWSFRYPKTADRETAIKNAIRAFDRLRLARDDKIWQLLLTPAERNKGIVLSKLNIGVGSQHSAAGTPIADAATEKAINSAVGTPSLGMSPRPNPGKAVASVTKRLFAKDPQQAQKARKLEDAKEQKRKEREAAKQKTDGSPRKAASRPSGPSPLGNGRPRIASDVSERLPVTSARPIKAVANPSTRTPLAKADKLGGVNPKPKPVGVVHSRSASANTLPTVVKRKAFESNPVDRQPAAKHRKTDSVSSQSVKSMSSSNPNSTAHTSPDLAFEGSVNSDSSSSIVDGITFTQGVSMAQKFRDHFYPAYAKMYDEQLAIEERGGVVHKDAREKLWVMHRRLEQMKRDIEAASVHQRRLPSLV